METVTMHPKNNEQLSALKGFAKALKVEFETSKSPYNPDFVAKIKASAKQVEEGKYTTLDPSKSIWENIKQLTKAIGHHPLNKSSKTYV